METLIQEQTAGIADSLILAFQSYEQALYQIAEEINFRYRNSGEIILSAESVPQEEMRDFLTGIRGDMKNVAQVFMSYPSKRFFPKLVDVFPPIPHDQLFSKQFKTASPVHDALYYFQFVDTAFG